MISTIGTNPAWYTNPVTGALAGAATVGGIALSQIGRGRRTANRFVRGFEDPFGQELARISTMAQADPEAATAALRSAWNDFYGTAQSWIAKGGNEGKVAKQALANTALIGTVDRLAAQLGIPDLRSGGGTAGDHGPRLQPTGGTGFTLPTRNQVPNIPGQLGGQSLRNVAAGGNSFVSTRGGAPGARWPQPINWPSGPRVFGGGGFGTPPWARPTPGEPGSGPAGPGTPGEPGSGTPGGGGGSAPAPPWEGPTQGPGTGGGGGRARSLFYDYILPLAATSGLNLLGGFLGSSAAKEAATIQANAMEAAAKLQAQSAAEALALQKQMWEAARADMAPWLQTGNMARGRLSHLMGLEFDPSAPNVPLSQMYRGRG